MSNPDNNIESNEISMNEISTTLKSWYAYLLSKIKVIVIVAVIGSILGFYYCNFRIPFYTATCTFVLEDDDGGGGLGQYAALASMIGMDMGGGGGGIFKGDNILQLYTSRKMIEQTLLTKDTFNGNQQLLINRFIEFNDLQNKWKDKVDLTKLDFSLPHSKFNRTQDSVVSIIVELVNKKSLIVEKVDRKLSIIKVQFKNKDEAFAKSFTNNIVKNVNQFYINTKTKKSSENLAVLQKQADSVKNVLNSSIGGVASAIDANPNINPAFQRLRVTSQRRQVDVQASGAIYQEIVKNLELAKITFRKDKPLIQIIDNPVFPLENDRVGTLFGTILGGVLGLILALVFFSLRKALKILR